MTVMEFGDQFTWHKAARSANQGGNCVCVAAGGAQAGIRDSKQGPTGPALWITSTDMAALRAQLTY